MSEAQPGNQPEERNAQDLSYLYDFIYECPNPRMTAALKKLIDHWLESTEIVPEFSALLKRQLEITEEETVEVCWQLSINPKTPPSVLQDLCNGASSSLLERIAENSNTSACTLAQLSYQAVAEIRIATAANPATPLASIMMLVQE